MPTITVQNRTFDARPDRIDLRDRVYQPKLVSLPDRYPRIEDVERHVPQYAKTMVLDQGEEGACTGFGLAAVVNYLEWKRNGYDSARLKPVSPRMLYHIARMYDEWAGEDYEGSSCRGAMKGWHRHGVCTKELWPYRDTTGKVAFVPPADGWADDAASRPLGAYYRIDKASITDLQSAVYEVGAIYCSAQVHKGWFLEATKKPVVIKPDAEEAGRSRLCDRRLHRGRVCYTKLLGPRLGLPRLRHPELRGLGREWQRRLGGGARRTDAGSGRPRRLQHRSLQEGTAQPAGLFGVAGTLGRGFQYRNPKVRPLNESEAYHHTLVMGNNGMPINRILSVENAVKAAEHVCHSRPTDWFRGLADNRPRKLAIYAHGGLNSEEDSLTRIRLMAPYFRENGIYPLFITWKTGPLESIGGMLQDGLREIFRGQPEMRDEGIVDKIREAVAEARDRSIEVACANLLVKSLWSEMKQNAAAAATDGAGLALLAHHLLALKQQVANLELHLVGHSAGSLVLGYLLGLLDKKVKTEGLTLFAPACTLDFAVRYFGSAIADQKLKPETVHVDNMDDERERADSVGPYGKSLLYLVSRALESRHKTPLLGMEWAWTSQGMPQDHWADDAGSRKSRQDWAALAGKMTLRLHGKKREYVSTGGDRIRLAHGSFDNDVEVVSELLRRISGAALLAKVENLAY